ncbi:hypothetical protein [Stenotrophobium rhamnosiphilum]|uniref:Uncharacterized protein n=1 Tax=Stenotrophobium rhamnosiphilum TaxID=2029166 RepID=A0A2T5MF99_9GAMM|nr:hypothetical protein [Stenotrophobium rhamnosiphilum]PTU31253.1 hypothetical protein CJD38_07835 [Stenotrophobium rhamnosiphilum]
MTRLTREIEVLKSFPKQFVAGRETLALTAFPRLILLLEIIPRTDQAYGVGHEYDIVCELSLMRASGSQFKINVHISTSRQWPSAEAVIVEGNKADAAGLDLDALDSVVCEQVSSDELWKKHGNSMRALIQRWVTEHSLRSIATMSDFEIATALRTQSPDFYNEILTYVSTVDVTNPEIIRSYMRTALVRPQEVRDNMRNNPAPAKAYSAADQELMGQTIELNSHQNVKSTRGAEKKRA